MLRALAFVLLLAPTISSLTALEEDECSECAGDTDQGECPPACNACACRGARVTISSLLSVPPPAFGTAGITKRVDEGPPAPEPREILHVPKQTRA